MSSQTGAIGLEAVSRAPPVALSNSGKTSPRFGVRGLQGTGDAQG